MSGTIVTAVRTAPPTRAAWIITRGQALFNALLRRGLSFELACIAVPAILTHWIRETGATAEYNNNPGNIRAFGNGARMLLGGLDYRAFDSIDDGADAYLQVLERRYRKPLHELLTRHVTPVGWYDATMRAGYHPWSPQALTEYQQIYSRLTRGVSP